MPTTVTQTGYVSTSPVTVQVYVTQTQMSYGTITATQFVYVESYLSTKETGTAAVPANSAGQSSLSLQLPWFMVDLSGYWLLPGLVGIATFAAIAAITFRRRKHREARESVNYPSKIGTTHKEDEVLDYISSHGGAISLDQASQDLGLTPERLSENIEKLKTDGRLRGK